LHNAPPAGKRLGDGVVLTQMAIDRYFCPAMSVLSAELADLMLECDKPGWDGYGAEAVGMSAYEAAKRFIESFPPGFPAPSLSADTDGCVTFEWRESPRRVLLVSVHPPSRVDYAAIFGSAKLYGSEPSFGEQLPEAVRTLVQRLFAA
jgi:hypothetical protein